MTDPEAIDSSITPLLSIVTFGGRIFARAMSRISIEGAIDEIPRAGPVIIAANHASNLDAPVLGAWLIPRLGRRIHWLGKRELFAWPIVGWVAANGGVHPVDRDSADVEAFRLASRILDGGHVLFVFPEGTRSPDGAAPGGTRRGGAAGPPQRCPDRPDRDRRLEPRVAEGPALSASRWPRRGPCRAPFRPADELPAGTDRRAAKGLVTRMIMERIAALLPERQRGAYGTTGQPASGVQADPMP